MFLFFARNSESRAIWTFHRAFLEPPLGAQTLLGTQPSKSGSSGLSVKRVEHTDRPFKHREHWEPGLGQGGASGGAGVRAEVAGAQDPLVLCPRCRAARRTLNFREQNAHGLHSSSSEPVVLKMGFSGPSLSTLGTPRPAEPETLG